MQSNIWLLSAQGILDGKGNPVETPFGSRPVVAGDTQDGMVALIVDRHEVWTYVEKDWDKVTESDMRLNCVAFAPDGRLLLGTEKARLAWASDLGPDFIDSFDAVPERGFWKTPWGGPPDTRSLAVAADGTLYANIHVGWIVRSTDGGKSWQNTREGLEMDVHQVAAHRTQPNVVFAATARGFHISRNHGDTFERQSDGMPYHYQRACACFPDRDVYLTSTSRGPHGQADALLYRSEDAGKDWHLVKGLPQSIAANLDTFQIAALEGGKAFTVVNDTSLYASSDWGLHWTQINAELPEVSAIIVF